MCIWHEAFPVSVYKTYSKTFGWSVEDTCRTSPSMVVNPGPFCWQASYLQHRFFFQSTFLWIICTGIVSIWLPLFNVRIISFCWFDIRCHDVLMYANHSQEIHFFIRQHGGNNFYFLFRYWFFWFLSRHRNSYLSFHFKRRWLCLREVTFSTNIFYTLVLILPLWSLWCPEQEMC